MKGIKTCALGLLVFAGVFVSQSMAQTTPEFLKCAEGSDLFYPPECRNGTGAEFPVYFPFPYDCTQYFECTNGIARCIKCADGTRWDQQRLTCNHAGAVDCVIVTTTRRPAKSEDFSNQTCPEGYTGPIKHPSDCRLFYFCNNGGNPHLFECPSGLYFNPAIDACDHQYNVPECQSESQSI